MQKLIDSHAHLSLYPQEEQTRIIKRCARELGAVINSGFNLESNLATLELARKYPFIKPTLGHLSYQSPDFSKVYDLISAHEEIVAIGEIGLDYHHVHSREEREKHAQHFRRLLELAQKMDKPVVIHSRNAEKPLLDILDGFNLKVIMHCFNGSPEELECAVDRNYFISITTQVLYSKRVKQIVEHTPLNLILCETDSPFLWRGGTNYPWNVYKSARQISAIKNTKYNDTVRAVIMNTSRAFGIDTS